VREKVKREREQGKAVERKEPEGELLKVPTRRIL
jgi:hypothetical protein